MDSSTIVSNFLFFSIDRIFRIYMITIGRNHNTEKNNSLFVPASRIGKKTNEEGI